MEWLFWILYPISVVCAAYAFGRLNFKEFAAMAFVWPVFLFFGVVAWVLTQASELGDKHR